MKQLQNNFTTPEQSKRLLELGVPEDSADCALVRYLYFPIGEYEIKVLDEKYSRFIEMHDNTWEIHPCWSVGRLIEILFICVPRHEQMRVEKKYALKSLTEYAIATFDNSVAFGKMDFSRLEE